MFHISMYPSLTLYLVADVGKKKAECAANFIMKRCPNVKVDFLTCKIQDMPIEVSATLFLIRNMTVSNPF